jgi:hypothetical protein
MPFTLNQQIGTNWYGNVWLALASIAYTDDRSAYIKNVYTDLPARVAAMAQMPDPNNASATVAGTWCTDWGPIVTGDNANLMYAASYRANGVPLFVVISIRGTDTSETYTPVGLITQLAQDLDVENMVTWQDVLAANFGTTVPASPDPGVPAIANGSCAGLSDLLNMSAALTSPFTAPNGATTPAGSFPIQVYVQWLTDNLPGIPIVITGHSLGGCLATVLSTYFANLFKTATIVPHPFAPPSAGNAAWAALYQTTFANGGQVWWNTADIVPNAFQNIPALGRTLPSSQAPASLSNILYMWQAPYGGNLSIDILDAGAVEYYQNTVGATYVQLANTVSAVQKLDGAYMQPVPSGGNKCSNDWITQLMLQHFPPMYGYLIKNQLPNIPAFKTPPENNLLPNCTQPNGGA